MFSVKTPKGETYNLLIKSFPDFVSKSTEHCWGESFLLGGENLRRSDFDDSNLLS